jgi:2-phosphosulfolactate phosphatase
VAACRAELVLAGSLVVAAATAVHVRRLAPPLVTLVAMGDDSGHPEDRACALYLRALLRGEEADPDELLDPLRATRRYLEIAAGRVPWFPARDLELALRPNRFDFAMPVTPLAEGVPAYSIRKAAWAEARAAATAPVPPRPS